MKDIFKNIVAIMFHIWIMPFEIAIVIIVFIGYIPIKLFNGEKFFIFTRGQKQWKVTKLLEKITDYFEDLIIQ